MRLSRVLFVWVAKVTNPTSPNRQMTPPATRFILRHIQTEQGHTMRIILSLLLILLASQTLAQNRLADESSLYLQQHADNPVDWYPWGEEALQKARTENKMIFVSVGYAACHWCHVMKDESFEDAAIAAFMNEHFINIKIDRERRPDLDEQFIIVTSSLTGSSGWPNSVFMTPDAEPFYAGTYFPPDAFMQVMTEITKVWRDNNVALRAEAFTIAQGLRDYLDQTAVLGEVSSADINAAATAMLADLDPFNGGFGTAPKFPRENVLLFLLDQAERTGDASLLEAVTLTLDGIIKGGIHDHVGGGFHRYGTDPEWNIPHFEKMLYNQALIGRALLRAYSATGNPAYARAATRTFDYVLRAMRSPEGVFYAAEDADSLNVAGARVEGVFYAWTPAQINAVLGDDAATITQAFNVVEDGAFEGMNVLHLSEFPTETDQFDAALEALLVARSNRPAPIKDKKVILAWNAEMISTLAEASQVLDRPDYAQSAAQAAGFLLQELWPDNGLKRIWYEGRADVEAQLVDYAALGSALVAIYDYTDQEGVDWLTTADQLATDMVRLFADPDQAMRMNASAVGLGPFRPLDDNEVASGNAQALALLAQLDRRLARVGGIAPKLAAAIAIDAINTPRQRASILTALEALCCGPTGAMRVSNGGAVRVFSSADAESGNLLLKVDLREGWHINAHEPLEDYLIGMELAVTDAPVDKAVYPVAEVKELGFSETPLSLYEKAFVLTAPLGWRGTEPVRARLTLQACNDQVCLPPDDMVFWFW